MARKVFPRKKILLLGGGHANIQVLHELSKVDSRFFELTLISEFSKTPYSAMIPSYMAGVFQPEQFHFDLKKICSRFNYNFVEDRVTHIVGNLNQVKTATGKVFEYDVCSANLGIVPKRIETDCHDDNNTLYVKPISKFTSRWECLKNQFIKNKENLDLSIVGGGAAAFEIAIACRMLFPKPDASIRIITGQKGLLAEYNYRARDFAKQALLTHEIELFEGRRIFSITDKKLIFEDETFLSRDICIMATHAEAPNLFAASGVPTNQQGFVRVNDSLLVDGFKNLFAAGDCCDFQSKSLPKAGVFAVREGPIVSQNIKNLLMDRKELIKFEPQNNFLTILVSGKKQAIASYGKWAYHGQLAWWLKYFIDLRFMRRFR